MTSSLTSALRSPSPAPPSIADRVPPRGWLALGAVLTIVSGPRWGIGLLAWIAPVPYLLYARRARGWRAWTALAGTLLVAFGMQCAMLATPPVPVIATLAFGPPFAIARFGALAAGEIVRRRRGEAAGVVAYVAATVVLDWAGALELGAWTATANSQVEWLTFLQLASIAGLAGLGALMAWAAGTLAMLVASPRPARRARGAVVMAGVLIAGLAWSTFRIDRPVPGHDVAVATVVTTVGPDEHGMPDPATLTANTEMLFARTRIAADRGARLVVWNEVATLVTPAEESGFVARARALARERSIDLVLAYGVVVRDAPVLLDNKYVFIADDGAVLDTYQKHHPVPGEPSLRGTGPLHILERPYGRVGGAICYDYDFPAMAREHAHSGAELVVVPASDWRGIDPVHTFMARVRAIENGIPLVRAVRWSASGVFDAHGRVRGWMSAIDDTDGVMVARVPVGRISTLASALGDAPVALAAAVLIALLGLASRRRARDAVAASGRE